MKLFRTKNGEVFNLDDLSRITRAYKAKDKDEWVYTLVPKAYVNINACPMVRVDEEEYAALMRHFRETDELIGWWEMNGQTTAMR